jgi:hypothetical protein
VWAGRDAEESGKIRRSGRERAEKASRERGRRREVLENKRREVGEVRGEKRCG